MISDLNLIPGLHAPIDPKEWNLTLGEDHAVACISSEPAKENTSSTYSAKDFEQLFEVDMDALWHVATKRIEEATGKEADKDDIEEALEPIAQATAAKLVLAYQCHDDLVKALESVQESLDLLLDPTVLPSGSPLLPEGSVVRGVIEGSFFGVREQIAAALAKARGEEAAQ